MARTKQTARKHFSPSSDDSSSSSTPMSSSSSLSSDSESEVDVDNRRHTVCKFGCNKKCNPGFTARGNPFDTCCKSCAISKGNPLRHDKECVLRNSFNHSRKRKSKKAFKKVKKKKRPKKKSSFQHNFYNNNNNDNNTNNAWGASNQVSAVPAFIPHTKSSDSISGNSFGHSNSFGSIDLSQLYHEDDNHIPYDLLSPSDHPNMNDSSNNLNMSVGDLVSSTKHIDYLELDDWMISLDDASLNKLSTAQLIQRLRSNGLDYKGMRHELIQRWKKYKSGKPKNGLKQKA